MGYDVGLMPVHVHSNVDTICIADAQTKMSISEKVSHAIRIGNANTAANTLLKLN